MYCSVPHTLIEFAMEFFWISEKLRNLIMQYYGDFGMRLSTVQYAPTWQKLEVEISMGCAISPILYVLAMEVITRAAERARPGVVLDGEELPPIRPFMDDLTILTSSTEAAEAILTKLEQLTG